MTPQAMRKQPKIEQPETHITLGRKKSKTERPKARISLGKKNTETERLEARITSEKKSLLRHAADLSGWSLTDFIINSAYEAATRVIQEHEQLHLSSKDREIFIHALLNTPKASKKLLNAVKEYQKSVVSE